VTPPAPTAFLLATALSVLACDRVETTRECQALAAAVNPALATIETRQRSGGERPDALAEIATRYEWLAFDLAALHFSDPDVAGTVTEYVAMFRQTARDLRALRAASERHDVAAANKSRLDVGEQSRREKILVRRLGQVCQPL
jgi:hypothetical protein